MFESVIVKLSFENEFLNFLILSHRRALEFRGSGGITILGRAALRANIIHLGTHLFKVKAGLSVIEAFN